MLYGIELSGDCEHGVHFTFRSTAFKQILVHQYIYFFLLQFILCYCWCYNWFICITPNKVCLSSVS